MFFVLFFPKDDESYQYRRPFTYSMEICIYFHSLQPLPSFWLWLCFLFSPLFSVLLVL